MRALPRAAVQVAMSEVLKVFKIDA